MVAGIDPDQLLSTFGIQEFISTSSKAITFDANFFSFTNGFSFLSYKCGKSKLTNMTSTFLFIYYAN